MNAPLVTLLTDFGAGSGYPAQMKGVMLGIAPGLSIVDLSHEVAPYDVLAGALLLEACAPWFPDEAVHCAVVDPGVGTARLSLALVDARGRRFVGPDNGLFTPFLDGARAVVELARVPVGPARRSATFHGRDLFAPAAAWLAGGGDPAALGPSVAAPVRLHWPSATHRGETVTGECLAADAFGNLLTSIRDGDLSGDPVVSVRVGHSTARWVRTFGEGASGELLALVGSGGRIEVAVREGNAARQYSLGRGTPIVVTVRGGARG